MPNSVYLCGSVDGGEGVAMEGEGKLGVIIVGEIREMV